jgi:hypothetical protein
LFGQLLDMVKNEVTRVLMTVQIESTEQVAQAAQAIEARADAFSNLTYTAPDETGQPKAKLQYPVAAPEKPLQRPEPNIIKGALQKINKAVNKATDFAKDLAPKPTLALADQPLCKIKVGSIASCGSNIAFASFKQNLPIV